MSTILFGLLFASVSTSSSAPSAATSTIAEQTPPTSDGRAQRREGFEDEDVRPTLRIFERDGAELLIGGLVQVHAAPFVGEDALVENGDAASHEGLRLRRARLGVSGRFEEVFRVFIAADLLAGAEDTGIVSDAKLAVELTRWLSIAAGLGKVPFTRGALTSSSRLLGLERPLSIGVIVPSRRLGVGLEGAVWGDRLTYDLAVLNGSEGFAIGNRAGGIIYGGRLVLAPFGMPDLDAPGSEDPLLAIGASGLYENGPTASGASWSADALATWHGAILQAEVLCDQRGPREAPAVSPALPDELERCGVYGEAGYGFAVLQIPTTLTARVERFDDNRGLKDAGDALLVSGGVNVSLFDGYARAQLHYQARREIHGAERSNDSLVLSLQGAF